MDIIDIAGEVAIWIASSLMGIWFFWLLTNPNSKPRKYLKKIRKNFTAIP